MKYGKVNKLGLSREDQKGYYLNDDKGEEIFLSKNSIDAQYKEGDQVEVFIYKDGHKIITDKRPFVQLEEFGYLQVKRIDKEGAYVDWGLDKNLLVPIDEQMQEMVENGRYLIFVYEDEETGDLRGSQKVNDFVFFDEIDVKRGDEVDLLLYRETDLGMNVIVNNLFKGLIFRSDLHKSVKTGDCLKGFVKQVREDGKLDILLEPLGYKSSTPGNTQVILQALESNKGVLNLNDKSKPDEIKSALGLSKKAFKRAIGHLYKQKLIDISENGISLLKSDQKIKPADSSI